MSNSKTKNPALIIMKRELKSYFSGPIAYIVTGLFLIVTGIVFFIFPYTFFAYRMAELRNFFGQLPKILALFIPALTMRIVAEERRSGSYETLMTLPVTEVQVIIGKYLAVLIEALVMVAPTLFYIVVVSVFGHPDFGPIVGGFIGVIFLCACYSAIGIFASSLTKNQIISFAIAAAVCFILSVMDSTFLMFLPTPITSLLNYLSANSHFTSISRGIIDTRDLIYFISLTAFFIVLTVKINQNAKK
ncbi:MAG: ABC transporter permease subunit [Treponema sp.]|nr:ABC transporter permease subunit [Treponema sp.]